MIRYTVHVPRLYDTEGLGDATELHCAAVLRILRDAEANCIILVDGEGVIRAEWDSYLKLWPDDFRKRAELLQERLEGRARFVTLGSAEIQRVKGLRSRGCETALGILNKEGRTGVGPDSCACGSTCGAGRKSAIQITTYELAPFCDERWRDERFRVTAGSSSKADFERAVLEPVFRYANYVRIIDRYVGRQFQSDIAVRRRGGAGPRPMTQSYQKSLEWLFQTFVTHSQRKYGGLFEIVCGVESGILDSAEQLAVTKQLREFANRMTRKHKYRMDIIVKRERESRELHHARYLFTDQVSLLVERGFDLLIEGNDKAFDMIKDVDIVHIYDPGSIEAEVDRLETVL